MLSTAHVIGLVPPWADMVIALWVASYDTLRAQILKKIKILKFSSELEIFKRATHQTPIFCGGILEVRIENFKRD